MIGGRGAPLRELTLRAVLCGLLFGVLFGAANAHLGLKAGLTVSTSIPIAVLSVAVFKLARSGGSTLLEANLAQTIGSASSSLASGTIFTIPALFMWGVAPPYLQMVLLAFLGGVLGILAMVPLRRLLIVQADAELPYPEGRACAEVLFASEKGAAGGKWIFVGIALGALIKVVIATFHLLPEDVAWKPGFLPNGSLAIKIAPALLAVGYIVGYRSASVMVAGGLVSSLVLYPLVTKAWGSAGASEALTTGAAKDRFVLYIGAGAVAAAALVTVARTAPTMARSLSAVVAGLQKRAAATSDERTDRDLPAPFLVVGVLALVLALALVPGILGGELSLGARIVAALGVALFGFLFVPVSSRLVGLIGVSSNPTSAMALITLAGTATVFALQGWKGTGAMAAVLTVGTVVCVAASKAGDISQDLKTGWLVKGTPVLQQFGQLLAASVACWAVAGVVYAIGNSPEASFTSEHDPMPAPQARLMKTMIEAVLGEGLPWDLLAVGAALSAVGTLVGLAALPFALGIYLPLSTMATVFAGGVVRRIVEARFPGSSKAVERGILCASGYVAGEGLAGVLIAGWALYTRQGRTSTPEPTPWEMAAALLALCAAGYVLLRAARSAQS
jgi:putative OPT family oligopeptide transporter